MARRCPRCQSLSIRHDRSLSGRAVCGRCGLILDQQGRSNRRQRSGSALRPGARQGRTLLAWLLPAGLLGAYLAMAGNPELIATMLEPYAPRSGSSWPIRTPADVELLIDSAARADEGTAATTTGQESAHRVKEIITGLKQAGVRIVIDDDLKKGAAGQWEPNRRLIRIRPSSAARGTAVLSEILAHEATHVAQSCHAGGLNRNSQALGIAVDPARHHRQQLDSDLYAGKPQNKAIELEAFSIGSQPELAVPLLKYYCKG